MERSEEIIRKLVFEEHELSEPLAYGEDRQSDFELTKKAVRALMLINPEREHLNERNLKELLVMFAHNGTEAEQDLGYSMLDRDFKRTLFDVLWYRDPIKIVSGRKSAREEAEEHERVMKKIGMSFEFEEAVEEELQLIWAEILIEEQEQLEEELAMLSEAQSQE